LFDLHHGLDQLSRDTDKLIACFEHYLALEGHPITRAMAEQRMLQKLTRGLTEDITPLLPAGVHFTDTHAMPIRFVCHHLAPAGKHRLHLRIEVFLNLRRGFLAGF